MNRFARDVMIMDTDIAMDIPDFLEVTAFSLPNVSIEKYLFSVHQWFWELSS